MHVRIRMHVTVYVYMDTRKDGVEHMDGLMEGGRDGWRNDDVWVCMHTCIHACMHLHLVDIATTCMCSTIHQVKSRSQHQAQGARGALLPVFESWKIECFLSTGAYSLYT